MGVGAKSAFASIRDSDHFYRYIALNVLCGSIWHPFVHLSPNIFERRFGLTELEASTSAAYLLSGSVILYPVCGIIVDRMKRGSVVVQLLAVASILTLFCFFWMTLPPTLTLTPWPAIVCFGTAMGFAPLLLVVIVPRIVSLEYVSTTLGLHKSLEHTGTTITQTLSGLWLDSRKEEGKSGSLAILSANEPRLQWLLNGFLFVNLLHLAAIWGLGYLNGKRENPQREGRVRDEACVENGECQDASGSSSGTEGLLSSPDLPSQGSINQPPDDGHTTSPLLHHRDASSVYQGYGTQPLPKKPQQDTAPTGAITPAEARRGKFFATLCAAAVVFAWLLFFVTSFIKLRSRRERGGRP